MSTAQKSSISQFLANVASGKAAKEKAESDLAVAIARITELETSSTTLTTELAATKSALTALEVSHSEERAAHTSLITAHTSLCTTLGFKPAEISGKSEVELQAAFTAKVSAHATEQLANLGFDPNKLPAPTTADASQPKELSYDDFSKLTPAQKMDFCIKGGRIL